MASLASSEIQAATIGPLKVIRVPGVDNPAVSSSHETADTNNAGSQHEPKRNQSFGCVLAGHKSDVGAILVLRTLPESLAQKAGMRLGQRLIALEGKSLIDKDMPDVAPMLAALRQERKECQLVVQDAEQDSVRRLLSRAQAAKLRRSQSEESRQPDIHTENDIIPVFIDDDAKQLATRLFLTSRSSPAKEVDTIQSLLFRVSTVQVSLDDLTDAFNTCQNTAGQPVLTQLLSCSVSSMLQRLHNLHALPPGTGLLAVHGLCLLSSDTKTVLSRLGDQAINPEHVDLLVQIPVLENSSNHSIQAQEGTAASRSSNDKGTKPEKLDDFHPIQNQEAGPGRVKEVGSNQPVDSPIISPETSNAHRRTFHSDEAAADASDLPEVSSRSRTSSVASRSIRGTRDALAGLTRRIGSKMSGSLRGGSQRLKPGPSDLETFDAVDLPEVGQVRAVTVTDFTNVAFVVVDDNKSEALPKSQATANASEVRSGSGTFVYSVTSSTLAKAGLHARDHIVRIDDIDVSTKPCRDVVDILAAKIRPSFADDGNAGHVMVTLFVEQQPELFARLASSSSQPASRPVRHVLMAGKRTSDVGIVPVAPLRNPGRVFVWDITEDDLLAASAGIKVGDNIMSIDSFDCTDMTYAQAVSLYGARGNVCTFKVQSGHQDWKQYRPRQVRVKKLNGQLGFILCGPEEDAVHPQHCTGSYVYNTTRPQLASVMQRGDRILRVDVVDVSDMACRHVRRAIVGAGQKVLLKLQYDPVGFVMLETEVKAIMAAGGDQLHYNMDLPQADLDADHESDDVSDHGVEQRPDMVDEAVGSDDDIIAPVKESGVGTDDGQLELELTAGARPPSRGGRRVSSRQSHSPDAEVLNNLADAALSTGAHDDDLASLSRHDSGSELASNDEDFAANNGEGSDSDSILDNAADLADMARRKGSVHVKFGLPHEFSDSGDEHAAVDDDEEAPESATPSNAQSDDEVAGAGTRPGVYAQDSLDKEGNAEGTVAKAMSNQADRPTLSSAPQVDRGFDSDVGQVDPGEVMAAETTVSEQRSSPTLFTSTRDQPAGKRVDALLQMAQQVGEKIQQADAELETQLGDSQVGNREPDVAANSQVSRDHDIEDGDGGRPAPHQSSSFSLDRFRHAAQAVSAISTLQRYRAVQPPDDEAVDEVAGCQPKSPRQVIVSLDQDEPCTPSEATEEDGRRRRSRVSVADLTVHFHDSAASRASVSPSPRVSVSDEAESANDVVDLSKRALQLADQRLSRLIAQRRDVVQRTLSELNSPTMATNGGEISDLDSPVSSTRTPESLAMRMPAKKAKTALLTEPEYSGEAALGDIPESNQFNSRPSSGGGRQRRVSFGPVTPIEQTRRAESLAASPAGTLHIQTTEDSSADAIRRRRRESFNDVEGAVTAPAERSQIAAASSAHRRVDTFDRSMSIEEEHVHEEMVAAEGTCPSGSGRPTSAQSTVSMDNSPVSQRFTSSSSDTISSTDATGVVSGSIASDSIRSGEEPSCEQSSSSGSATEVIRASSAVSDGAGQAANQPLTIAERRRQSQQQGRPILYRFDAPAHPSAEEGDPGSQRAGPPVSKQQGGVNEMVVSRSSKTAETRSFTEITVNDEAPSHRRAQHGPDPHAGLHIRNRPRSTKSSGSSASSSASRYHTPPATTLGHVRSRTRSDVARFAEDESASPFYTPSATFLGRGDVATTRGLREEHSVQDVSVDNGAKQPPARHLRITDQYITYTRRRVLRNGGSYAPGASSSSDRSVRQPSASAQEQGRRFDDDANTVHEQRHQHHQHRLQPRLPDQERQYAKQLESEATNVIGGDVGLDTTGMDHYHLEGDLENVSEADFPHAVAQRILDDPHASTALKGLVRRLRATWERMASPERRVLASKAGLVHANVHFDVDERTNPVNGDQIAQARVQVDEYSGQHSQSGEASSMRPSSHLLRKYHKADSRGLPMTPSSASSQELLQQKPWHASKPASSPALTSYTAGSRRRPGRSFSVPSVGYRDFHSAAIREEMESVYVRHMHEMSRQQRLAMMKLFDLLEED